MTSKEFSKKNGFIDCKLILQNGEEFVIPLREDGYVCATKLCKAGGKKISNWFRLIETKEYIQKHNEELKKAWLTLEATENKLSVFTKQGGNAFQNDFFSL